MIRDFYLLTTGNADAINPAHYWQPQDAASFMANWLKQLYLANNTITLELQPGDITCYRFCVTPITPLSHPYAAPTHLLWHDCTNDRYVCLPTEIMIPSQLLKYLLPSGHWNSVTITVLAELHFAFCEHSLQSVEAATRTYKPRFYDWIKHRPIIEESIEKETSK